jgi:putative FmdB family regulatory protein
MDRVPTYEYECLKCKFRFEEFQKITDEPIQICPECKGKVTKVISGGAGLLFKGSGFYTTDYRSKDYVEAEKKEIGYKEPKPKKPKEKKISIDKK